MIERMILSRMIHDDEYVRKVAPFVKPEYFQNKIERIIFSLEIDFFTTYNKLASKEALLIDVQRLGILNENDYKEAVSIIDSLKEQNTDLQWALNTTEEFCKDQALHNALRKSIKLAADDGTDKKPGLSKGAIPQLLSDALAVSFDSKIGHDYFRDAEQRFDYYHDQKRHIPLSLPIWNKITNGGFTGRTLNMFLMGTHVGKTSLMCNEAAFQVVSGYNVLYITLEIREEEIGKRIDAKLLEIAMKDLEKYPKEYFFKKIDNLRNKSNGILKIREFPSGAANVSNFRHLLFDLLQKENFKPDIIYIDYLNLCSSVQVKMGNSVNSYTYYGMISVELRALGIEFDVPIVTATQLNRNGTKSNDPDMSDMAESFQVNFGLDFLVAGYTNETLKQLHQIAFTQLKNRYTNVDENHKFNLGFDSQYMKYYEVEQIIDDVPIMDNSNFGEGLKREKKSKFDMQEFK